METMAQSLVEVMTMMTMVGNNSYGLVMGGRKKEIREEVLVSVFCAFKETFVFGMFFHKLSGA